MRARTKYIFLDLGGVTTTVELESQGTYCIPRCAEALNHILSHTDARIVVSSIWRMGMDTEELEEFLCGLGIEAEGRVVGKTPCLLDGNRGEEIASWLACQGAGAQYLILDDSTEVYGPNCVHTHPDVGLTASQAVEAVNRLQ